MKKLAYHELGHASHYEGTSNSYWRTVIAAEVGALGHGNANVNFAGHIQIAESWAEHMALTMVKQQYPSPTANSNTLVSTWEIQHEQVRNESLNHIPIGIYNDMLDGVNLSEFTFNEDGENLRNINDPVAGGFTNSFFASILDASVDSPDDLRRRCVDNLPVGVTNLDINILFGEY